jgi:PrtD family type I secretion system ABC transporter
MSENFKNPMGYALAAVKKNIAITAFFSLFINLLMFVAPLHMLQVYDRVLTSRSEMTLIVLTALAIFLLMIYGLLEAIRSRLLVKTGIKVDEILNAPTFKAVFSESLVQGNTSSSQAVRDLDAIRNFLGGGGMNALCDAPWVPLFILAGFLLHPILGFVSLAGAVVIFCLAIVNEFATRGLFKEANDLAISSTNAVTASLRNVEVVKALGMLGTIRNRWSKTHNEQLSIQFKAGNRAGVSLALSRFVRMALQVLILAVGGYLAIIDEITPGTMIAGSIIMGRALAPVEMAVGQWRTFVSIRDAYIRLSKLLERAPETVEPMDLPSPRGEVKLENLIVVPPGGKAPILKNVTLNAVPGEIIGLIGPSGSGKSTLARTMVGVWPVSSGVVRIDGAELRQWDPEKLGPHIGFMPQDVELFEGTIAENIARFTDVSSQKVLDAAQRSGAHDIITVLPEGYDTKIGAQGAGLSGGQRQQIALARAIYGDPRLIVLDEPNANLDLDGERNLAKALLEMKKSKCTVFVISHRPSLLSVVDKIAVLRAGELVKFGERDSVLADLTGKTESL